MSYYIKYDFIRSQAKGARRTDGRWKAIIYRREPRKALKSKTLATRRDAEQWAQDYLADLRRGIQFGAPDTIDAQMTLSELISLYNAGPGLTITLQRSRQIEWWKQQLGNRPLVHLTYADIQIVIDDYLESSCLVYNRSTGKPQPFNRKRTPASARRQLAALRAVFVWACKKSQGYASADPTADVELPAENNERKQHLSREQVIELLSLARDSDVTEWDRAYLFYLGLIHTGARLNEWLQMEWQHIDLDAGTALVEHTKNGEPKLLALTDDIVTELRSIRSREAVIGGLVFPSPSNPARAYDHRRSWTTIKRRMGMDYPMGHPDYIRIHDLRHTAASLLVKAGATLPQVAEILGHKALQSTNRYSHLCAKGKQQIANQVMGGLSLTSEG